MIESLSFESIAGFIIAGVVGYWGNLQKKIIAQKTSEIQYVKQENADLNKSKQQTIDYLDPNSPEDTPPQNLKYIPMPPAVRSFLLSGLPDHERLELSRQIDEYEINKVRAYILKHSKGYTIIRNGQIAGGGSPGAPVPTEVPKLS